MKIAAICFLTVICAVTPAESQCTGPNCHMIGNGALYDSVGGPFLSGHIYVFTSIATVPTGETLTIQAGAIIKFDTQGFLPYPLNVSGNVQALGTPASPIIFTSIADDVGGDTNGDGNATAPAPGQWKGCQFGFGSGSVTPNNLNSCVFRFAGESGTPVLSIATNDMSVTACSFSDSSATAIDLGSSAKPLVGDCSFIACARPINSLPLNGLEGFTNNTSSNNTITNEIAIRFDSSSSSVLGIQTWDVENTMNGSGVLICGVSPNVLSSSTLTIGPGMILKGTSPSFGFNVTGTLIADGAVGAEIVFTTIDDDIGGDTLLDGPTTVAPGAWRRLSFSSTAAASVLDHVKCRFGGGSPAAGTIVLSSVNLGISHTVIENSLTAGISLTSATSMISNCEFNNNQVAVEGLSIASLPFFLNNSASGNLGGDFVSIGTSTLLGPESLTLGPSNALSTPAGPGAFVLTGTITIGSGATLTLEPGTVMKSSGPNGMTVAGALDAQGTMAAPIIFTSLKHDLGGDTNNDGALTTPSPGDWNGLTFSSASSTLEFVTVCYAGAGGNQANIFLSGADIVMSDCLSSHSAGAALDLTSTSRPIVTDCAFDDSAQAVARVPIDGVGGITGCSAANNTGGNYLELANGFITTNVVFATANSLNQTGVFVIDSNLAIGATGRLELASSTVLKMSGQFSITVDGELAIPVGSATITSIADDSDGDDTDNANVTPMPGDWGRIQLTNAPLVENLTIRYGGGGGSSAVALIGASIGLENVTIEDSVSAAISLVVGTSPIVKNCAFIDCARAVEPVTVNGIQGFESNTASGNTVGDHLILAGLGGGGTQSLGPIQSLNGTGLFIVDGNFSGSGGAGAQLMITQGTVIKVAGAHLISIQAQLHVIGDPVTPSPVVFTSINDDAHGPDTNGNGPPPQPGDWVGFVFASGSDNSSLTDVLIRYAGAEASAGAGPAPAVNLFASNVVLSHVQIEKCAGTALHANETSTPIVENCTFNCNGGMAIDGVTWDLLGGISGLSAFGNLGGDFTVIDSPLCTTQVVVRRSSYVGSAIIVNVSPVLGPNASLSFTEGVIIKSALDVHYMLNDGSTIAGTANFPVVMTSVTDDEHGGDTNMDGPATTPAPGDWGGIESTNMPLIRHLLLRYGGQMKPMSALFYVGIEGPIPRIQSTRVEYCGGDGIHSLSIMTNCVAFANDGAGIRGGVVRYCTSAYNGGVGMRNGFLMDASFYGCNSWANGGDNYAGIIYGPPPPAFFFTRLLTYCNGYTPIPCGSPNICPPLHYLSDVDPMFVDGPNGDLRLSFGSPLLDVIPLSSPIPENTLGGTYDMGTTPEDIEGFPRQLDSDGPGASPALSDVGAHESSIFRLDSAGLPRIGTTISWAIGGPPGNGILVVGDGQNHQHFPPYGYLLAGLETTVQVLGVRPVGVPYTLAIPLVPIIDGFPLAVQAIVFPSASPANASLTNAWKGTLFL